MGEYIDTSTGEIVDTTTPRSRVKVASTKQVVGVDTKYPTECITADSLLEALRNLDAHLHHKPMISYDYLTDSLTQKLLTVQEVELLAHLSKTLTAWNYWIGSRGELDTAMPKMKTRRTLQALVDKGMVRILHTDKPFRHDLVLKVNPVVAFRGGHIFRETSITGWYSASRTFMST